MTASTSVASIHPAQSVSIDLTIYNRGEEAVNLRLEECVPPYEVLDSSGAVVGPGNRMCSLSLTAPIVVPAGGSMQYTTTWTGESTMLGPADGPVYLDPGTYAIRPRVLVVAEGGGYVYGPLLPITITP